MKKVIDEPFGSDVRVTFLHRMCLLKLLLLLLLSLLLLFLLELQPRLLHEMLMKLSLLLLRVQLLLLLLLLLLGQEPILRLLLFLLWLRLLHRPAWTRRGGRRSKSRRWAGKKQREPLLCVRECRCC